MCWGEDARAMERAQYEGSLIEFFKRAWREIAPAALKLNWHHEVIAEHLEAVSREEIKQLLINIPPGCTKALAIDTPVLTTWGWKRHGDLAPGDFVFGPDGIPKRVEGALAGNAAALLSGEMGRWSDAGCERRSF